MNEPDENADDEWVDVSEVREDEEEQSGYRQRRNAVVGRWHDSDLFDADHSVGGHLIIGAVFSPARRESDGAEEDADPPKSSRAAKKSGFELRLSLSFAEASPAAKRVAGESERSEKSGSQSDHDAFSESLHESEASRESKAGGKVKTQKQLHQEAKAQFEISISLSGQGKDEERSDNPGFKYKREKKGQGVNSQYEHNIGIPDPVTAAKSIAKGVSEGFSKLKSKFKGPGARRSADKEAGLAKSEPHKDIEMTTMPSSKSAGSKADK